MPLSTYDHTIVDGGTSTRVATNNATSTQSIAFPGVPPANANIPQGPVSVVITVTAAMFVRKGVNPVAVADGTDMYMIPGLHYHTYVMPGERLAFINETAATGFAYVSPGA